MVWRVFVSIGLMLLAGLPTASAMNVYTIGDQVFMEGETVPGDYERLKIQLDQSPVPITTVILRNGIGGEPYAGMNVSRLIMERGLRTAVTGHCVSACAWIYLAGAERHFADGPLGKTFVGFHAAYDDRTNQPRYDLARMWIEWARQRTDGKMSEELIERFTRINMAGGLLRFYDAARLRRKDHISVFFCHGGEEKTDRDCEKIGGTDGYAQGIFTSKELIRINGTQVGSSHP